MLQRPLPKRSQQPVKASALHSHTKRAFSPLNSESKCMSNCSLSYWRENLFMGLWSPIELLLLLRRSLLRAQPHDCAFQTPAQLKKGASSPVTLVSDLVFLLPNWRDWQEPGGKCPLNRNAKLLMKMEVGIFYFYFFILCARNEQRNLWGTNFSFRATKRPQRTSLNATVSHDGNCVEKRKKNIRWLTKFNLIQSQHDDLLRF